MTESQASQNSRVYGPLSPIHLKLLQEHLDRIQSKYRVFTDEDLLKKAQVRPKGSLDASPLLHNSPQFLLKEYLFIEIPLKDVLAVREILVRLGYEQRPDTETEKSLEIEEMVCPLCDYMQYQPGYCPKHHTLLVQYFDKPKARAFELKSWAKFIALIFLLIVFFLKYFI